LRVMTVLFRRRGFLAEFHKIFLVDGQGGTA
jgi:hypothetical protein